MGAGNQGNAKIGRWVAKTVHAGIEGFAFLWTVSGKPAWPSLYPDTRSVYWDG